MPPKGTGAPYKNGTRYWGDFRTYADVGGSREPLIPPGEKLATKDPGIARELYDRRRQELKAKRIGATASDTPEMHPAMYAAQRYLPHLEQKKRNRRGQRVGEPLKKRDVEAIHAAKHALTTCLSQPALANVTALSAVSTQHITELIQQLYRVVGRHGKTLSPQTVRRHLMVLSGMFARARFEKFMDGNPVAGHPDVPPQDRGSALDPNGFLTRPEVKGLLEELVPTPKNPWAVEQGYTLYYTGCRLDELNGLLVRDVDFDAKMLWVLEYEHRGVKSKYSRRPVPLWPKLEHVLRASLDRTPRHRDGLLFPRPGTKVDDDLEAQMMTRLRKSLQSAARRANITKPMGHHVARHSYVSARLEMVEKTPLGQDVPVSNSVIRREVGHATDDLIQTTYGHLPRARVRQTILDYGDELPDFEERVKRGKALMSKAVKAGLKKAKERRAQETVRAATNDAQVIATGPKTHKAPQRMRGQFAKREKAVE